MRNVIRLGDSTSHGGKVLSCGLTNFTINGIAVASVGDKCSCPMPGHGCCTIVSGSSRHIVNGRLLAFEGDQTSCGARLMAAHDNFSST